MDVLMVAVTVVALALAVGMSIVAVRLLRGERSRSAARVSALESAALEFDDDDGADDPDEPLMRLRDDFDEAGPEMEIDLAAGPMFTATDEPKAPGRRWLALAGVAMVMAAIVGTVYIVFKPAAVGAASSSSPAANASQPGAASAPPTGAESGTTSVSQANQLRPIELLSLKHTIEGTTFSLAGLVVNPIDAAPLTRVVAVVYLFDKDGAYFASGKSQLEFTGLRPGEESPFTIKIPNVSHIGKYRVGFRREDGSVIAHVDKRGQRAAGSMTEGGQ